MDTIIVTDKVKSLQFLTDVMPVIASDMYLSSETYLKQKSLRVINMCESYAYQSIGYYISLLAEARQHKVLPSIHRIQDILTVSLSKFLSKDLSDELQSALKDENMKSVKVSVFFGTHPDKRLNVLAKKLYALFPLPMMEYVFELKKNWEIKSIHPISISLLTTEDKVRMITALTIYLSKKRLFETKKKQALYHIAMLLDPKETHPPSNVKAIETFIHIGKEMNIQVDKIDKGDMKSLLEYDGLLIRTTTAVNHYTYRFARCALESDLIVVDDPISIVKCTNKVYLSELLTHHKIPSLDTVIISKYAKNLPKVTFPLVLKKPDSAFSEGVIKIEDNAMLVASLKQFFKTSDLVIAQPFMPTDFDWRIGVFDGKPLFACKYHMAKNHWQIYDWDSKEKNTGENEAIPLQAVPSAIMKTALKASKLIGNGLYGVDIKVRGNKHYVIEINDNPNIDAGIEDGVMGESLYKDIFDVFIKRIRRKHGYG
jgi:glutathione synthase/RimK-type ligase-like ATP-grasp enzyme